MNKKQLDTIVKWEHLLPEEFLQRQQDQPTVYLPLGICEPHGHIAPFGLDTIKAEYLCEEAAKRFGGIVAPTLGYQIHEAGYHAQWLEEVVGEVNPRMTAMPPEVMLKFFIYQLRAFTNAGFKSILVITGHAGGNQKDYQLVAKTFMKEVDVDVVVMADPELVEGKYEGDHAGKYEISQLLHLRPDLMSIDRLERIKSDSLGQFAQGSDASEATAELGKEIIEESLGEMNRIIDQFNNSQKQGNEQLMTYAETEHIWNKILQQKKDWVTLSPKEGQTAVSQQSQWYPYERIK